MDITTMKKILLVLTSRTPWARRARPPATTWRRRPTRGNCSGTRATSWTSPPCAGGRPAGRRAEDDPVQVEDSRRTRPPRPPSTTPKVSVVSPFPVRRRVPGEGTAPWTSPATRGCGSVAAVYSSGGVVGAVCHGRPAGGRGALQRREPALPGGKVAAFHHRRGGGGDGAGGHGALPAAGQARGAGRRRQGGGGLRREHPSTLVARPSPRPVWPGDDQAAHRGGARAEGRGGAGRLQPARRRDAEKADDED
ncbi:hypothetical protein QJS66_18170 [Kocuria rhizophila]|nr:hypothetical protein QJS66_18170 [Kocuria rhizophila]